MLDVIPNCVELPFRIKGHQLQNAINQRILEKMTSRIHEPTWEQIKVISPNDRLKPAVDRVLSREVRLLSVNPLVGVVELFLKLVARTVTLWRWSGSRTF